MEKGVSMINISKKNILALILVTGFAIPSAYSKPIMNTQTVHTLVAMESPAEDMLDAIDSKNMGKMQSLYHTLSISMVELNHSPAKDNIQDRKFAMLNSWFDLISLEMEEMDDFPALANAINQFSGQLIVATKFEHPYQKDIAWMDYLGRELLLLNKFPSKSTHHEALLTIRKAELNRTWETIKLLLNKQDGRALIKKVEPTIQSILSESDPSKLAKLSTKELDLVDDIETFFHM